MEQTQTIPTVEGDAQAAVPAPAPVVEKDKKRGKHATKTADRTALTVTFTFNTTPDPTIEVVDLKTWPEETKVASMLHGALQKFGDAYANAKSASEALGMFQKVRDSVLADGWDGRRGEGVAVESVELLAQAVFQAINTPVPEGYGKVKDFDAIKAQIEAADTSARRNYRGDPKVAYFLAKLKAKAEDITTQFGIA